MCYIISEYRVWLGLDRIIYTKYPGKCRKLLESGGSEDFAELDDDTILLSSGLNAFGMPGSIYVLYTNGSLEKARLADVGQDDNPLISPHGLSIWKEKDTDTSFLYVVTHGVESEGVAVFKVQKNPLTLIYVKTITDDTFFGFMNDLAVVDSDKFYITQTVRWKSLLTWLMESLLLLPTGKLIYYDGTRGKVVLSGLKMPNGVALSNDKRRLYVAETLTHTIHSLSLQSDGSVTTNWVYNIGAGPDNLHVDTKTGDIWTGACPKLITGVDQIGILGYKPVGQVMRLRMKDDEITNVEEVFTDNGHLVSGSSIAIYRKKKVFIGTITSQLVMCDVHYLNEE